VARQVVRAETAAFDMNCDGVMSDSDLIQVRVRRANDGHCRA